MNVPIERVLQLLGAKEVEITLLRERLELAEAKCSALEASLRQMTGEPT